MGSARRRRRRARWRGLVARSLGVSLGALLALLVIVGLQIPLMGRGPSVVVTAPSVPPTSAPALAWPTVGSAAIDVPSLGVLEGYHSAVAPIASLTKLMTAYVALKKWPLRLGQSGPCTVVNTQDVATFTAMVAIDESSVVVVPGERLCEFDLLDGLLVHSAGNYAVILADMIAGSSGAYVALMNRTAAALGLTGTSYHDVTGYSSASVSTALDQARLAVLLMKSPLIRFIVNQTSVTLPVAGVVGSFTPDVGSDNVVGVKSGRTFQAGGCDVMAVLFHEGATTKTVYSVVLGQRGGNLLAPAGAAALALANSAISGVRHVTFAAHTTVADIVWGGRRVNVGPTASEGVWWWPTGGRVTLVVHLRHLTSSIRRGEAIGQLIVSGATRRGIALRAFANLAPPTLLERLR